MRVFASPESKRVGKNAVFADATEEFSTLEAVLDKFASWKRGHPQAYNDAYVSMSLPEAVAPYVRVEVRLFHFPTHVCACLCARGRVPTRACVYVLEHALPIVMATVVDDEPCALIC